MVHTNFRTVGFEPFSLTFRSEKIYIFNKVFETCSTKEYKKHLDTLNSVVATFNAFKVPPTIKKINLF